MNSFRKGRILCASDEINQVIEKFFWIILIMGILLELATGSFETPKFLPKILLGMMLFFVFLK